LTVMVVNKALDAPTSVTLALSHFGGVSAAQVWQLAGTGTIAHLSDAAVRGGHIAATLPAQSVTLFVLPVK
jgi:O-glycosyl hydrolase